MPVTAPLDAICVIVLKKFVLVTVASAAGPVITSSNAVPKKSVPVIVNVIPDTSPPAENIVTFLGCSAADVVKLIVLESCNAPLIVRLAAPAFVCAAHTPFLSLAIKSDVISTQPILAALPVATAVPPEVPPTI